MGMAPLDFVMLESEFDTIHDYSITIKKILGGLCACVVLQNVENLEL